jgi:hypothetical protein
MKFVNEQKKDKNNNFLTWKKVDNQVASNKYRFSLFSLLPILMWRNFETILTSFVDSSQTIFALDCASCDLWKHFVAIYLPDDR